MNFQKLSLKQTEHKYVDIQDLSSVMSISYLSEFELANVKHKNMGHHRSSTPDTNSIIQEVNLMDLVPSFTGEQPQRFCGFSDAFPNSGSTSNIKKFDSYSQFSTMNILSYLVGGFVGSKSQVGATSMQGDRFQIWDLVWQKLLEIMDSEQLMSSDFQSAEPSESITDEVPTKQTYADVTKTKIQKCLSDRNCNQSKGMNSDRTRSAKQKKKQTMNSLCAFKGKLDFNRHDRKFNFQEMDCFSSSRWSNSRKKHSKKGMEKINKRDEREAARDGLDFINQELKRNNKNNHFNLLNSNTIECINNKMENKEPMELTTPKIKNHVLYKNKTKNKINCQLDNLGNNVLVCNHSISNSTSQKYKNNRQRFNSACSVDSDDSFIVFDRSANDVISYNTFNLLQNDDDSTSNLVLSHDHDKDGSRAWNFFSNPLCQKKRINRTKNNQFDIVTHVQQNNVAKKSKEPEFILPNLTCSIQYKPANPCSSDSDVKRSNGDVRSQYLKCRTASECSIDSEDSFITFDSAEDDSFSSTITDSSVSDYEVDLHGISLSCYTGYDSDNDDDDDEQITFALPCVFEVADEYESQEAWLENINALWENSMNTIPDKKNSFREKKVHFPADEKLVRVKTMFVWDYALRASRLGPWEEFARDTMRFHDRIHSITSKLQTVLDPIHRDRIWHERFELS